MKNGEAIAGICVAVLIGLFVISFAHASQVITIEIPAHKMMSRIFNLESGDKFAGSVSIMGGTGTLAGRIGCSIQGPSGDTIEIFSGGTVDWGGSFQFTASKSGAYTFLFANLDTQTNRTVTLSYDITSSDSQPSNPLSGFGLDPILVILGIVAIIAVVIPCVLWKIAKP